MRRITGTACLFACLALVAAPKAHADAISASAVGNGAAYDSPLARLALEGQNSSVAPVDEFPFSLCKRCAVAQDAPVIFSAGLSELSFKHGNGEGFGSRFGGAFIFTPPSLAPAALTPGNVSVALPISVAGPVVTFHNDHTSSPSSSSSSSSPVAFVGGGGSSVFESGPISRGGTAELADRGATTFASQPLAPNPEPATILMLGTGVALLVGSRRWRPRG